MKKIFSVIITTLVLISCINIVAFSYDESKRDELKNNFYVVITLTEDDNISRASGTKSGTKTITGYNGDTKLWDTTIKGIFSYNGSYATCTSASITYEIYSSSWKITSATATATGNKAIGNVTAKKYVLGILMKTVEESFTLTCSANGTLS